MNPTANVVGFFHKETAMTLLREYNPIQSFHVPGEHGHIDIQNPKGVVVIVGPNSSGKTLLLKDIENLLLHGTSKFIVCGGLTANRPENIDQFIDDLQNLNYLQRIPTNANIFRTYVPYLNTLHKSQREDRGQLSLDQLKQTYSKFDINSMAHVEAWFKMIGVTLVGHVSLDERRAVCNRVNKFDHQAAAPDLPLQGLYVNDVAQDKLEEETSRVFANTVWLDASAQNMFQLRLSGSPKGPTPGERTNPLKAGKFQPIENEGDGFRSYTGICISMLVTKRPVMLIDEPELCLHPPQAYQIGRFIGSNEDNHRVTFVATHSSHVLRGILEAGRNVSVIRLTRKRSQFFGKVLSNQQLDASIRNPRSRAEVILDGLFSKGVVLVESDADREMYRAASENLHEASSQEVHFAPVGGSGGVAEPFKFYRTLDIPVAVIADLDVICDIGKVRALLGEMNVPPELEVQWSKLCESIKALHPTITEAEVREQLISLSQQEIDWANGDDNALRRKLNELSSRIRRLRSLKEGGIESYRAHPAIYTELQVVVNAFATHGLFFVPVGELEDWLKPLMLDMPKNGISKTERSLIAAERIRSSHQKEGDIWDFTRRVFEYLNNRNTV
ncbi:MAG TPA: AAA family ATPase [Gemmatales bacterium]|nr:AAA family ATPase [Gemmatales bacterium]